MKEVAHFVIGTEKEITKFKFYGNPEGTFEMDDQKIVLYKKSKALRKTFGAIAYAMSGKGKYEVEIKKNQIVSYRRDGTAKFWIDLSDTNKFYFCVQGIGKKDKANEVENFLLDAVKNSVTTSGMTGYSAANAGAQPAPQPTYTNSSVQPNMAYQTPPVQPVYTNPSAQPAYHMPSSSAQSQNPTSSKIKFSASYRTIPAHTETDTGATPVSLKQTSTVTAEAMEKVSEELKKYKKLLDDGLITEEDFTAKKRQLLNL